MPYTSLLLPGYFCGWFREWTNVIPWNAIGDVITDFLNFESYTISLRFLNLYQTVLMRLYFSNVMEECVVLRIWLKLTLTPVVILDFINEQVMFLTEILSFFYYHFYWPRYTIIFSDIRKECQIICKINIRNEIFLMFVNSNIKTKSDVYCFYHFEIRNASVSNYIDLFLYFCFILYTNNKRRFARSITVISLPQHVKLAKLFETYVKNDARFELLGNVTMGLVCFRLKVFLK
jgi:hypothetical protein